MNTRTNLTQVNYNKVSNKRNKYIVIHYVGAVSTAWANSVYFKTAYRGASANWFVDDTEAVLVVDEKGVAWHCGDSLKKGNGGTYFNKCTNYNSIGIEMCCFMNNGKLDISDKTIANTIELVKELMAKYNIPVENVIRHYDVTNKICPAPFVENENRWNDFKSRLGAEIKPQPKPQPTEPDYTGTITYQAYDGKWETEVYKADGTPQGYAGDSINYISGVRAKPQYGEIIIEAHELGGHWLGAVSSKDYKTNDTMDGNSYAGIYNKPQDAFRIKSTRGYVDYRVLVKINGKLKWLDWVRGFGDNSNEYAGIFGLPIYGIQMK